MHPEPAIPLDTEVRGYLENLGVEHCDVRCGYDAQDDAASQTLRGAALTPEGDWFHFAQSAGKPLVLVKAETPAQTEEAQRLWSLYTPREDNDDPPRVSSSSTPDLPGVGREWHEKAGAALDRNADPIARLRAAKKALKDIAEPRDKVLQKARAVESGVPEHHRRYLRHLGHRDADIDAGRVSLAGDQQPQALRWMAKSVRARAAALAEFGGDDDGEA